MPLPFRRPATLALLTGALAGAGLLAGVTALTAPPTPAPITTQTISDEAPGDISGPCDEAEHNSDPRCGATTADSTNTTASTALSTTDRATATTAPAASTATSTPGDISGPCDEAEHANDPRCTGAESAGEDNSGPGSRHSGHDDDDADDDDRDDEDRSGSNSGSDDDDDDSDDDDSDDDNSGRGSDDD